MLKIIIYIESALLLLLLAGCGMERFTGYKQEAKQIAKITNIQGEILDTFTKKPIWGAVFQAREQQTVSDRTGFFEIDLVLNDDDEYSRPMEIYITAKKFYPSVHKRIIMPFTNHLRFTLDRAAPVIDTTILIEIEDSTQDTIKYYLCQTIITDYQGASTVNNVRGIFSYADEGKPAGLLSIMNRIRNISDITSHWQTNFSLKSKYRLLHSYKIKATDNEGYSDKLDHINWKLDEQLLFPIE